MNYIEDGYEILQLSGNAQKIVSEARRKLTEVVGGDLETYHERRPANEDRALAEHQKCAEVVGPVPWKCIAEHLEYFRRLIGSDMHIQSDPYLRISRPGVATDNIGFHRDTWYGDTPYEVSCWIPLTDTDMGNCLQVSPKSHVWAEKAHPTERIARPDVEKGSPKHGLGFIYDPPKKLVSSVPMTPVPMKVGQMLVFPLSLLHGQQVNTSAYTRFSVDCRLANSLAPVKFTRSRSEAYYERFQTSPVTEVALRYEKANK